MSDVPAPIANTQPRDYDSQLDVSNNICQILPDFTQSNVCLQMTRI